MLKFSLANNKAGATIIKIHHDFGDFKFYLVPDENSNKSFSWHSEPNITDTQAGDYIATEAAKAVAAFAKRPTEKMSFQEMVACLQNAQRLEQ